MLSSFPLQTSVQTLRTESRCSAATNEKIARKGFASPQSINQNEAELMRDRNDRDCLSKMKVYLRNCVEIVNKQD